MIHFTRSGKQVRAEVKFISGDLNQTLFMYWECGSDVLAESLTRQLQRFLWDSIEQAMREMYEEGYRDGRGKQAKRDWFPQTIKHINSL